MGEKPRKTNLEERTKERRGHHLEKREPMANKRQAKWLLLQCGKLIKMEGH